MSAFDDANNQNTSPLDDLVGENKKFKTVEDLAKGKLEADRYIEELKAKLSEVETRISNEDYAKKLLEQIENRHQSEGNSDPIEPSKPGINSEDLEKLVKQHVSQFESERSVQENLNTCDEILVKAYGDKASETLRQRAEQLGVSMDDLKELAGKSPAAFSRLVIDNNSTGFRTENKFNMSSQTSREVRNYAFYKKMRQDNPTLYNSPAIKKEMIEQRMKLGEDFYKE